MINLLPGLRKFSEKVFPKQQALFESLSQGQKPHTLLITGSDSRIDPSLVTQTKPGEIFVVRNAGNIIPPFGASTGGEEAAIEFALEVLGVSNIVICGHYQCGTMAALFEHDNLNDLPAVRRWLKYAASTKRRALFLNATEMQVVEENVLVQAENLKTHPSVSYALRASRAHIFGWIYNFELGLVTIYDPKKKVFVPSCNVKDEIKNDTLSFAL
jgi:carbonic anhydrase